MSQSENNRFTFYKCIPVVRIYIYIIVSVCDLGTFVSGKKVWRVGRSYGIDTCTSYYALNTDTDSVCGPPYVHTPIYQPTAVSYNSIIFMIIVCVIIFDIVSLRLLLSPLLFFADVGQVLNVR